MGKVGFIGLGAMGRPMASNLARKGFPLVVHDTRREPVEALAALGATPGNGAAGVAQAADIVVTMLPDSPDVEAVVLGPGGVLDNARPGALLLDMSTVDPATSDRLAAAAAAKGVGFVDAPVGRLVTHAEAGTSLFMVGGSEADVARARPLLEAMGDTIHHCGPAGAGTRTKLVNNYLAIFSCMLNAEALALASAFKLDLATTLDVIYGTTAMNGQNKVNWPNKVLKGDTSPGFRIALAHKDASLIVEAARKAGVPMFVGVAVRECLGQAARTGDFAGKDFSALLDFVCQQAGVAPPRLKPPA
ncbi:MAG: NAD-binding protein [Rhodospirillaceae bacterium]|nr:NAD-binding protein [Rhodospirillaceae bacterium]